MARVADGFQLSVGAVLVEFGVPETKNKQLRDAPTVEERGDGRNDTLPKMGEEVLRHKDGEDREKREEEEEKESKLVAGISPDDEKGAEDGEKSVEDIKNAKQEGSVEREKEDHATINNLTPPLNAPQLWEASEIITRSPNPPSSRRHVVSASEGPASPASPGEVRSGSPVPAEALQQPGHGLGQHSEDVNRVSQAEIYEFPSKKQTEAPKMSQVGAMANPFKAKGANFTRNSSGDKKVEEVEVRKLNPGWSPLRERVLKSTGKRNQTSPQQQNRGSKHKNMTGSREKKKMDNRTPNVPIRKQDTPPTHFPYFLDDYCPPECACYGR